MGSGFAIDDSKVKREEAIKRVSLEAMNVSVNALIAVNNNIIVVGEERLEGIKECIQRESVEEFIQTTAKSN